MSFDLAFCVFFLFFDSRKGHMPIYYPLSWENGVCLDESLVSGAIYSLFKLTWPMVYMQYRAKCGPSYLERTIKKNFRSNNFVKETNWFYLCDDILDLLWEPGLRWLKLLLCFCRKLLTLFEVYSCECIIKSCVLNLRNK